MTIEKINFNNIEHISFEVPTNRMTITDAYNTFKFNGRKPTYIINGTLFNMDLTTNSTITFGKSKGKSIGYVFDKEGICFDDNKIKWSTLSNTKDSIVCGSPRLLKNGIIDINWGNKVSSYLKNPAVRTAIGINNDSLFLFLGSNNQTLEQLSKMMKDNGCAHALNLDGGGSICGYFNGKLIRNTSRKLANFICVWEKESNGENDMNKQYKVVLDPGHGKNTLGKRSPDGSLMEYDFNRKVSRKIKYHLERHKVEVVYSCDIEIPVDISLFERCKIANNVKADIFVSIHANAQGNIWSNANGWEIYVLALGGNAEKLAKSIEKESIPYLGLKNRGIKTANFQVLRDTKMPAVLIEHAFMDNRKECELMKTEQFQEKCAIADAKGILKYLGTKWKGEDKMENDNQRPSDWATSAWTWSVENKICDGKDPKSIPTKEQIMCYFKRFEDYLIKNK